MTDLNIKGIDIVSTQNEVARVVVQGEPPFIHGVDIGEQPKIP